MKKRETSERVEEILDSLEGIRRAEPGDWFFSRLQAKIARSTANGDTLNQSAWYRLGAILSRPAVAATGLLAILLLNGFLLLKQPGSPAQRSAQEQISSSDNESLTASNSSFEYENLVQP